MKQVKLLVLIWATLLFLQSGRAVAQTQEAEQLLLNVEKLAQLKKILENMYQGYQVVSKGYTTIKDISEGNFRLHQIFLDGLLEVSPVVKSYKRVSDIISCQKRMMQEGRQAFQRFSSGKQFTIQEIAYLSQVYQNLLEQSAKLLEELILVMTAGKLRMSDDERMRAIDRIYSRVQDQYAFLKQFSNNAALLALLREKERKEIANSRKIHNIK